MKGQSGLSSSILRTNTRKPHELFMTVNKKNSLLSADAPNKHSV